MSGPSEAGERGPGWHVAIGDMTYGPCSWEQLLAWVGEGRLGPDARVWHPQALAWIRARDVPGLLPASSPLPSPPVRRRLGGFQIASICLTVVILLAGAGVGAWLALRGDGGAAVGVTTTTAGGVAAGPADTAPLIGVETLNLGGKVVLPEGAALSPADLTMLTNTHEAACATGGDFQVDAVHDEGARTVLLAVNGVRNPVLMAMTKAGAADMQPSVASTARALVLYEPAFLGLPPSAFAAAEERLESHPSLPELETALAQAIRSDAVAPLDADAHPELYEISARIGADLYADIVQVDEQAERQRLGAETFRGQVLLASRGPEAAGGKDAPLLLAAAGSGNFVDVIDDPGHSTPEVTLVNTTWAAYSVSWTCTTPKGTTKGFTFLPRCAPWRVDTGSLKLGWPPVGFKLEKLVMAGDGRLDFKFERNNDYMVLDISANLCVLLVGAGAESIRKFAGDGAGLAAATNTLAAFGQLAKEYGALAGRLQGQSMSGCAKEVGGFLLVSGGKVVMAFWPLLQGEIKEEFVTVLGKVVTRRMAAMAVLGYASVDLIAQFKALGDSSIASYQTGDVQLANVYPFTVTFEVSATSKQAGTYVFQADIRGLPANFTVPLELVVDYGDGSKKESFEPNIFSGEGTVAFKHTYSGAVPEKAVVTLQTTGSAASVVASQNVTLPVEEKPAQGPVNGTWKVTTHRGDGTVGVDYWVVDIGAGGTGKAVVGASPGSGIDFQAEYKSGRLQVVSTVWQSATQDGPRSKLSEVTYTGAPTSSGGLAGEWRQEFFPAAWVPGDQGSVSKGTWEAERVE